MFRSESEIQNFHYDPLEFKKFVPDWRSVKWADMLPAVL